MVISHTQKSPILLFTLFKIMYTDTRTKVLIKFGTSEMMYIELRAKSYENLMCTDCCECVYMQEFLSTHAHRSHQ